MTNENARERYAQKATYTVDDFEDYYRKLIERWCAETGYVYDLDAWDGARENMRDDCMVWDEQTMEDTNEPAYTDQDLIDEYLYFHLTDAVDEFLESQGHSGMTGYYAHTENVITYNVFPDPNSLKFETWQADYVDENGTITITNPRRVES